MSMKLVVYIRRIIRGLHVTLQDSALQRLLQVLSGGMRIIAELTDWLVPEEWHTSWDLVGKDTFEGMSYLVEPDSVDYG